MNTPTLYTDRLLLRRFTPNDLEAFFLIFSDTAANRFLPWYPVRNRAEAKDFFEKRYAARYDKAQGCAYAICLKNDNLPIGYINIADDESHDLGYGLRSDFWRQGIAAEAGRAVIAQAKRDGLPYLTATHDKNNPASGAVMQKIGMTYRYSYEEQWQPKNFPVIFRMYQLNLHCESDFVYRRYWEMSSEHFVEEVPLCYQTKR